MPKESTKHIPKPQNPIGWVKQGKIKVQDGDTGKVFWRSVRRGLVLDNDSEPTSQVHDKDLAKIPNNHSPRMGKKRKKTPETRG